jgi:hypothetical protein
MGLRLFRRIKLAPGLTLNLSKSGPSFSLGPRGLHYTVRPTEGKSRVTAGIPGTGLYYTKQLGAKKSKQTGQEPTKPDQFSRGEPQSIPPEVAHRLNLGFFQRLVTPAAE